jgi:hypothetical protein
MLAEDHGHDRKHKLFTEIWIIPTWESPARSAQTRTRV